MKENPKKLYRSRTNRVIAGVCGGLGKYFNIDPIIFRILFVLLALGQGVGILFYIILIFVIPLEPGEKEITQKEEVKQIAENIKEKAKGVASEFKDKKEWWEEPRNLIGLILIVLGVIFLFGQIFPFSFFKWQFIWPSLIILIGLYVILKSTRK